MKIIIEETSKKIPDLPKDIMNIIMITSDVKTLKNMCILHRNMKCDANFWKRKFENDEIPFILIYKPKNLQNWVDDYIMASKIKENIKTNEIDNFAVIQTREALKVISNESDKKGNFFTSKDIRVDTKLLKFFVTAKMLEEFGSHPARAKKIFNVFLGENFVYLNIAAYKGGMKGKEQIIYQAEIYGLTNKMFLGYFSILDIGVLVYTIFHFYPSVAFFQDKVI